MRELLYNAFVAAVSFNTSITFDPDTLTFDPIQYPFYHSSRPSVIPNLNDKVMSLFAPIIAYWGLSLFFHLLDSDLFQWAARYRMHESAEIRSRNLVSKKDVIIAVILQQIIQTLMGIMWLKNGEQDHSGNHVDEMKSLSVWVGFIAIKIFGQERGRVIWTTQGPQLVSWLYWWAIPSLQFLLGIFIMDTWQYFWHRALHMNKTLYKRIHAVHHRLYVPYAYGALYNHPLEGFILDTLGAAAAESLTGMTVRQAAFLFMLSSLKTVDDHCGYALPWDPLQILFGNNADYHDIHHQTIGIKSNFSQPYFIHWDVLLGTRMTRSQINERHAKSQERRDKDK